MPFPGGHPTKSNGQLLRWGCSWLAVQNRYEVLSSGNRSDGESERKSQLFESRHAENDSTAGRQERTGTSSARLVCATIEAAYGF
jgi:hypothetical protein